MADTNSTLCQCGCGNQAPIATCNWRSRGYVKGQPIRYILGHNGVLSRKHGHAGTRGSGKTKTYKAWHGMIDRCKNQKDWSGYGGRGIKVCKRWLHSFENFLADMGERPEGKSLDRQNNDGDYEPSNCRWATPSEQANNRRSNIRVDAFGKSQTIRQWAREIGIKHETLCKRYHRGDRPPHLFRDIR